MTSPKETSSLFFHSTFETFFSVSVYLNIYVFFQNLNLFSYFHLKIVYQYIFFDTLINDSRYGEVVNINLVRDKVTGKAKGFAFICYENQQSTILAVDNFNGIKVLKMGYLYSLKCFSTNH